MGKEQELLEAARNGNVAVVDKILSSKSKKTGPLASLRRGPNPNCQDVNGYTPLHHAALNGHKEAVSLLLYHDASVNVVDNKGSSPLHLAAWNGNVEIVRMLLSQGPLYPNINLENHDNETALHCAAQYGHTEVVLILLKQICNSAIRNNRDETALDLAAQYGRLETVELLIKTHPELINCVGKKHSALHLASRNGHRQVVQVLLEAGFDINTQTENGSALHEAALFGKVDVARLLLDCEIDIKIKDLNGKTVLDLLKDHKSQKAQEITEIIEGCHTPLIDLNSSTSSNWHADPPSSTGPYQNILLPNHIKQSTPKTDIHRPGVPPPPPPPPLHSDSSSSSEIYQTPPRPKVVVADNKYEVSTPGNNSISSDTSGIYETPPHPKSIETSVDKGQTDIWLTANSPIVGGSYLHMGPFSPTKPGSKPQKPPRKSLAPTSPPIREESKAYEYIYLASTGISNKVDHRSSQSYEFMQLSSEVKLTPHKGRQYENVGKDELNTFPKRERRASESRELTRRSSFGQCESRESHRRSSISHMETSWRSSITHSEGGRRGSMSYGESAEKLRRSSISYGESPERIRNGSGSCIIIKSQDNNNMLSSKFGSEKLFSSNCERLEKPTKLDLTSKRSSAPEIPLSPTGYDQPPTPDHPPPSPHTAESGIHEKIRPLSQQPRHKWSYHDFGASWDETYFSEPDYLSEVRPFTANLKSFEFLSLDEVTLTECEYKYKRRSRDMETITDEEFLRSIEPVYKEHKSVSTENMEDVNDNTPFAGLKRGSISSDKERWRSRHSWGKSSSLTYMNVPPPPPPTSTSPKQELENGSQSRNDTSDYQKRDSLVVMSPLDENAEWAKIEDIMASFGGGVARESVFARELEEEFNRRLWADKYCFDKLEGNSVGDWLRKYELEQYENMLVANGFDNTDFLGGNILEEEELIEMGVTNAEHRQRILAAAITLPSIQPVGDGHNSLSVEQWLESLHLSEYVRVFMDNGFTDMSRVRKIWEVELTTVLEINSLGHRKRILASLGDRPAESLSNSSHAHLNNLEYDLPNIQSQLSSGHSEDSSLFKDYSGITPQHIPSEQDKSFQNQSLAFSLDRSKWSTMRCSISPEISVRPPGLIGNPTIPIRHWRHKPDVLVKGCCNYTAQYLGSTLVTEPKGLNSTKESITKIKISNKDVAKIPSIQLSISYKGVKFIDAKSKLVICEHEIRNIHCACQDGDDLNYFAYITKDHLTEKHYCHVFKVKSMELATDIILTLGQAFEVAYQMALKETAALSAKHFEQSLTSSEESGNGAPKEKNKVRVHSRKYSSS